MVTSFNKKKGNKHLAVVSNRVITILEFPALTIKSRIIFHKPDSEKNLKFVQEKKMRFILPCP